MTANEWLLRTSKTLVVLTLSRDYFLLKLCNECLTRAPHGQLLLNLEIQVAFRSLIVTRTPEES